MKNIHFDYSGLQNNILPFLSSSIYNLKKASSILSSMKIPSDCPYLGVIRNSATKAMGCVNQLNKAVSDINDTNIKLDTVIDDFMVNISKIPVTKFK